MTTYYVGSGGADGNAGTSWALRKETLNGAEDIPVAANDTVYVGAGTYRELLTVDVSGTSGNPIAYIADVTGEHTDGIGGVVRITGSDNDQTATRAHCVESDGFDYRTFRGFAMDTVSGNLIDIDGDGTNWIVEDCYFEAGGTYGIWIDDAGADCTIRRCFFKMMDFDNAIHLWDDAFQSDTGHVIENCVFVGGDGIILNKVGGVTVRNCTFIACYYGMYYTASPDAGQSTTVNNCLFAGGGTALRAQAIGEIVEDYNNIWGFNTARTNVTAGGNSTAYVTLLDHLILLDGFKFYEPFFQLSEFSQLRAITGSGTASDDFYGQTRPATAAKLSWGAVQFPHDEIETTTIYEGSAAFEFTDAGRKQIKIATDGSEITISLRVYREANYAGTNPQLVVKQPGQSDRTTTDTGSAGSWNSISDTFTPAADPEWVIVEMVSNNTAAAGSYAVYFDDLEIS